MTISVRELNPTRPLESAALDIRSVKKLFGQLIALHEICLRVRHGEFLTLLGSSGSGKTTLLRIIAGLTEPTEGAVSIGGRDVTHLPIEKRDIGFVFQNYALFPHLSVRDNIGFGLKLRRYPAARLKARTDEMMELTHLSSLGSRFPSELSGGQQQRVAVARALAPAPKLLLLDEPLGALDRRLRQELGLELKRIQRDTKVTAIYVTHDQDEAFLLSDRIAVMEAGRVLQLDSPRTIYRDPTNLFVANFVGETCRMKGLLREISGGAGRVDVGGLVIDAVPADGATAGMPVVVVVRPEQISVKRCKSMQSRSGAPATFVGGFVRSRTFLGNRLRLKLEASGIDLEAELDGSRDEEFEDGCFVEIAWQFGSPRAFPAQSEKII
ncbi:ABC transporter ATP-binding protein [Mesorhizobium sp. M3A.F.Ca.ET.080.04.2.1]|uniref:ABC transporter ATP-binding protein n=1 Tax=Mesorhizobium sp. M3A.F.Ca.ET.080.04.2.1 TaxID=2493676 RepID=UPI000F758F16|nr:ABC transporter ATP-binding protein [Mesorhizobium sp. M3A.F.Ca.ET.080.04.2.1]AZO07866.1 ABC transporter ATP-binding protein [Mesorhizobium sp. M3A.F.Ca.ET.080.04.2.1]RWF22990.1 MAG: ABC transporter ATP-binding protein [Mesorhizobium sp.]